jgi:eukaryotic-like serine/threonine-protein kinase
MLAPGTRLGVYEILARIGAGGMGDVYRARDTRLGRDVALKILPDSFAADPERIARMQREAHLLAVLNHPNIAAIYGFEDSGAVRALVLEFVGGETLADRIARGAIPLDEALPIARQIAEALEAAHEEGIIHRDLKPANIKVRPDGTVKVLDFGLAKVAERSARQAPTPVELSMSPTVTSPASISGVGVLLGTAAYMSPEQAKGKPADKRSDIWAFGCVLFEMLTGRQAFGGNNAMEAMARSIEREPDWTALPGSVPPTLRHLLRLCLDKDPTRRRQSAGDLRIDLEHLEAQPLTMPSAPGMSDSRHSRRPRILIGATVLLAVAAVLGTVWLSNTTRSQTPRISRLAIMTTAATSLAINGNDRDVAITPDGSRVVYVGNSGRDLFVRPLDALDSLRLFTGAPRGPFVSPDGQWVGFIDGAAALNKVAATGGPAIPVATLDGGSRGATWTPQNTIVFATAAPTTGLQEVADDGGPTRILTRPDRARGEADHVWPELLPDGQAVLFTIAPITGGVEAAQIAVYDRQTGTQKVLVRGGSHAHYVDSGHLVYAAGNTLRAVAFNPATLETRGSPVEIVSDMLTTEAPPAGGMNGGIARDDTFVYVRGSGTYTRQRALVWVDRQGHETAIPAPLHAYFSPRISPDGNRIAVWVAEQDSDLWLWDATRLTIARLTFTPGIDTYPVWTPDGRRLIFGSEREGTRNMYWQAADGTGGVDALIRSANVQYPVAITPDGSRLIFTETAPKTAEDVMQLELTPNHTATPLVRSSFAERNGVVSPDNRWLAYEANDSGQLEIYVRPYPNVNSGHWQVSNGGGTRPAWSPNGRELFYVSPTGAIMGVAVSEGASWAASAPTSLVKADYETTPPGSLNRNYDVSPDGRRFLLVKPVNGPGDLPTQMVVVQHFDELLKRFVPVK